MTLSFDRVASYIQIKASWPAGAALTRRRTAADRVPGQELCSSTIPSDTGGNAKSLNGEARNAQCTFGAKLHGRAPPCYLVITHAGKPAHSHTLGNVFIVYIRVSSENQKP